MEKARWIKRILLVLILSFFVFFNAMWQDQRKELQKKHSYENNNSGFEVCVKQRQGTFFCNPEKVVYEMAITMIPEKRECESFYTEYHNLSQEQKANFWKAISIICRTNLYIEWERQIFPEQMVFPVDKFCITDDIYGKNTYEAKDELLDDALSAQKATQGIIIGNKKNHLPYFYLSAGATRQLNKDCQQDKTNEAYVSFKIYEKKKFVETVNEKYDPGKWSINDLCMYRDKAGYVNEIKILDKIIDGNDFQKLFQLSSPCFYIREQKNNIVIVTNGIGHGYGLCVSYSMYLASKDNNYEEILHYFFDDISLERKYGV